MRMAEKIKQAHHDGFAYIIFWSPGCPYSEEAKKLGIKIRSKGEKVRIIKVSHIADRAGVEKDATEMARIISQSKTLKSVSWPQIFKLTRDKIQHLSGGYDEFRREV